MNCYSIGRKTGELCKATTDRTAAIPKKHTMVEDFFGSKYGFLARFARKLRENSIPEEKKILHHGVIACNWNGYRVATTTTSPSIVVDKSKEAHRKSNDFKRTITRRLGKMG